MKNPFLFKRGRYYHLEYFDNTEQRIKRISTGEAKKNDAIKFLMEFDKNRKINRKQNLFYFLNSLSNMRNTLTINHTRHKILTDLQFINQE